VDVTGAEMLESLAGELSSSGVRFGLANVQHEVRINLERAGVLERIGAEFIFPTLNTANEAFLSRTRA
jgi:sulfate permease, SulP family